MSRNGRLVRPVEAVRREPLGIEKSAPQVVYTGSLPGIDDFLGEVVVGKVLLILDDGATCCLLCGYLGLIEVLKRVVVPRLVLPGKYGEECCQKHAFEEKGGEEEGNEKCRMTDDFHNEPKTPRRL